jgi:predicted transcriptional regulator
MDIPLSVVEAVKETKADLAKQPVKRAPYAKKLTKRILHAIGNGLRTSTSIANALNLPKEKIQSNLAHMKNRGYVYSSKQEGKLEHKYHLTTDKPVLGTTDLTKKKAKVKNKYEFSGKAIPTAKPRSLEKVTPHPILTNTKEDKAFDVEMNRLVQRLNALELTLVEKEKEVWSLECEVFDKKAIIKYLEEKLFVLGVK